MGNNTKTNQDTINITIINIQTIRLTIRSNFDYIWPFSHKNAHIKKTLENFSRLLRLLKNLKNFCEIEFV